MCLIHKQGHFLLETEKDLPSLGYRSCRTEVHRSTGGVPYHGSPRVLITDNHRPTKIQHVIDIVRTVYPQGRQPGYPSEVEPVVPVKQVHE